MPPQALQTPRRPCFRKGRRGDLLIEVPSITLCFEFDFAGQFDDGFRMMAVFEQRVFDGLRAVHEQAAIEAVLLLGDPVAAFVAADEDDVRCRTARWRFDEFHVGVPSRA